MDENSQVNTGGGLINSGSVTAGKDLVGRDKYELNFSSVSADTLESVLRGLLNAQKAPAPSKEMLFTRHIEPTFLKMEQVHKDYEKALLALREQVAAGDIDTRGLQAWFEAKSIQFRSERAYLKNIDVEIDALLGGIDNNLEFKTFRELLKEFSSSIIHYFNREGYPSIYTWVLQELRKMNDPNFLPGEERTLENTKYPLQRWIDDMLMDLIPSNWEAITRTYLKLRGISLT